MQLVALVSQLTQPELTRPELTRQGTENHATYFIHAIFIFLFVFLPFFAAFQ